MKDVKRYLNVATIAKDGLLTMRRGNGLAPPRECIVVPRHLLDGLLLAIHIKLNHPSAYQLKNVVSRYFYALDMDNAISRMSESCHQCNALKTIPHTVVEQSTSDPPRCGWSVICH